MAKIQCKMCGGLLELPENAQSGTCEYCGSRVTFPKITSEQQEKLYDRAEHFRRLNDYGKAQRIYEQIVEASPDDAEAYWGLVLCRYGIEYVEDPATRERIPTCHRVSYDSILADADYLAALEHAGSAEREIYEAEAKRIAEIQKGILAIAAQEEPFDIFICYKESDDSGRRTRDSVAAQEIYYALTEQNYKVFFARITLEKKLGQQYEPYIFAALNSAKAMLVIGSKPEHFNSVWVRNEWSRYLELMKRDRSRILIPCYRDMDAYDIPEELSMFQAQDMGKIGFIQDLLHGIAKVAKRGLSSAASAPSAAAAPQSASGGENPLLVRAQLFVETANFDSAKEYCERVLDAEPRNSNAYFFRLMAELKISDEAQLVEVKGLEDNSTFKLARKFADDKLAAKLDGILQTQEEKRRREEEEKRRREEEEKRRREEEARRREEEIKAIRQRARQRRDLLARYIDTIDTMATVNDEDRLYALRKCEAAEAQLISSESPTPEDELQVKSATESALAQAGDLSELEQEKRRILEKQRKEDIWGYCIFLLFIVVGVVGVSIGAVASCHAETRRQEEETRRQEEETRRQEDTRSIRALPFGAPESRRPRPHRQ